MAPNSASLFKEMTAVPSGRWAGGVSGGADSVALLLLLDQRRESEPGLFLHVVHLDHQTRGAESTADAEFVRRLAAGRGVPCTIARRDQVEREMTDLPPNPSARYRALRHEVFRRVIAQHRLQGVLLAHHADDQAETVLHRLSLRQFGEGLIDPPPQLLPGTGISLLFFPIVSKLSRVGRRAVLP